ncbi:MAG: SH3-like domain-containing protein [Pseudomonadota bacterium]
MADSTPRVSTLEDSGPAFETGTRVCVRDLEIAGHYRAPHYIRGRCGRIERYCGAFPNPERLAYGEDGLPCIQLYRVRFMQTDLWPDYAGGDGDTLDIEMYAHWLEGCPEDETSELDERDAARDAT